MRLGGHLQEYRALGGVAFALLRDSTGISQLTLKKGETDSRWFELFAGLPRESVLDVDGVVRRSAKANLGVEVAPTDVRVVTRAEVPLPLGVADRVGAELDTRLDHRVLDLRKPEVRRIFELRAAILGAFRTAFVRRGFLEVETPKILREGAEGGATLFGVDYFEARAFLAQSPQLYKQMLMSADFDRVFEIAPAFRAEPSDTVRHITEFTSLDAEMAYVEGSDEVRDLLESVVVETLGGTRQALQDTQPAMAARIPSPSLPFPRIPFRQVEEWLERPGAERDLGTEDEKRLGEIAAERFGAEFYFITDFPTSIKRSTFYARRQDDNPEVTTYFDLDFRGLELASGGMREHRYERLIDNIRGAGLDPGRFPAYLEAFRYGMPSHGGFGFGIDRFVQRLTDIANIREVRLFPRDRYRLAP